MTREEIYKELELEDYKKYERIDHDFKFWVIERLSGCFILSLSIIFGLGALCCAGMLGMIAIKILIWFYEVLF